MHTEKTFINPIINKNDVDIIEPIRSLSSLYELISLLKEFVNDASRILTIITIVECPNEKYNPTVKGSCPDNISLFVTLSIAAM